MQYKLRIYDGQYEVLSHLPFHAYLDLNTAAAEVLLLQRLASLTQLAISHNEPMGHPRLQVCDMTTGKVLMELVA
jgi:hypothetical protein